MKKVLNKKIIKYLIFATAATAIFVMVLLFCLKGREETSAIFNNYDLKLSYDENNHILTGKEEISYANNSENCFDKLYFHLYPNAFRREAKGGVVSQPNFDSAYPNGESFGEIKIKSVCDEKGENFEYNIEGKDENILALTLKEMLYPDETVVINIDFEVTLANINHRLGYGDNTINFGNFYPIACVYEDGKGFYQDLYHSNGDPFYSDCANYSVEITFNSDFQIASTGELVLSEKNGERVKNLYRANKVRDFCFTLSEKFEKVTKKVGHTNVNYYGYKGDNNLLKCLQVACDALGTFNDFFGDYPYKEFSVVKSNFVHGGMEYPGIVLISDKIKDEKDLNYVIVHEIAHQWWYGLVGNDEYNHAWIDEGLTEYSTLLFFEKHTEYGENFKEMINNSLKNYLLFEDVYKKVTGKVDGTMDRPLDKFDTEPEYSQCVYTRGVLMFNSFRELIGKNKFIDALQLVQKKYKYKNITPAQLISVFEKFGGRETESFFNNWLFDKVVLTKG